MYIFQHIIININAYSFQKCFTRPIRFFPQMHPDSLSLFFNVVLERGGKSNTPTKQLIVVSQMPQKSKAMCLKCFQKIKLKKN